MSNHEDWVPEDEEEAKPEVDLDAELQDLLAAEEEAEVVDAEAGADDPLAALTAERDEYLDLARRTQAEYENYRKRAQREIAESREAGAAGLAGRLIDVLDTVDLALAHDPSDAVAQIATTLFDSLSKEGLERIDALGSPFDPEVHDAVLHEEGDGAAEVIEVLRSGWRWNGKVVRAAMVKVKGS